MKNEKVIAGFGCLFSLLGAGALLLIAFCIHPLVGLSLLALGCLGLGWLFLAIAGS